MGFHLQDGNSRRVCFWTTCGWEAVSSCILTSGGNLILFHVSYLDKSPGSRSSDPHVQRGVGPNLHVGPSDSHQNLLHPPLARPLGGHHGRGPPVLHGAGVHQQLKKSPSPLDQAGEGLFAIDALPSGTIVSLFNGVRLKTATVAAQNRWFEFLRQIPFVNIAILKTGHPRITESGLTPTLTSTSRTSVLVWRWANYLSPCP